MLKKRKTKIYFCFFFFESQEREQEILRKKKPSKQTVSFEKTEATPHSTSQFHLLSFAFCFLCCFNGHDGFFNR